MATRQKTAAIDTTSGDTRLEVHPHHSHSGIFVVIVATAITVLVALLAFTIFGHSSGEKLTQRLETTSQNPSDYGQ